MSVTHENNLLLTQICINFVYEYVKNCLNIHHAAVMIIMPWKLHNKYTGMPVVLITVDKLNSLSVTIQKYQLFN